MKKIKHTIAICSGFGCIGMGADEIKTALQQEVEKCGLKNECTIKETGCLGLCSGSPMAFIYPEGVLYWKLKPEDAEEIVKEHILKGKIVERLVYADPLTARRAPLMEQIDFFKKQKRVALRNCGVVNPSDISDYVGNEGYDALSRVCVEMSPGEIIAVANKMVLAETDGTEAVAWHKWINLRKLNKPEKYVICNANGCDAGVFINRTILEGDPHSIIEGMAIAAYIVGASQGYIYLRPEYNLTTKRMKNALKEARKFGYIGTNILGTDFDFDLKICSDYSKPFSRRLTRLMPDSPYESHLSLSDVACVIHGPEAFANIPVHFGKQRYQHGESSQKREKATKVVALLGKVNNAGLVEVAQGTPLRKVIHDIGGGIVEGSTIKAVQIGGPFGGFIPEKDLDVPLDYDELKELDAPMGSGGLTVLDEGVDIVSLTKFFVDYVRDEFCKQCPEGLQCKKKLEHIREILNRLSENTGKKDDLQVLSELCAETKKESYCDIGGNFPNPVISAIRHFRKEFEDGIQVKSYVGLDVPDIPDVPDHSLDKTG